MIISRSQRVSFHLTDRHIKCVQALHFESDVGEASKPHIPVDNAFGADHWSLLSVAEAADWPMTLGIDVTDDISNAEYDRALYDWVVDHTEELQEFVQELPLAIEFMLRFGSQREARFVKHLGIWDEVKEDSKEWQDAIDKDAARLKVEQASAKEKRAADLEYQIKMLLEDREKIETGIADIRYQQAELRAAAKELRSDSKSV